MRRRRGGRKRRGPEEGRSEAMRRPKGKVTSQGRIRRRGNLRFEATRRREETSIGKNRARPSVANIWREDRKTGDCEGRRRKRVEQRDAKKRPTDA